MKDTKYRKSIFDNTEIKADFIMNVYKITNLLHLTKQKRVIFKCSY